MAGYRQEFDRALEAIEAKVIELFAMIVEYLPRATTALLNGSNEALPHLVRHQQEAKAWYPQVEAMVSREILRQAPVASDLRFLLSVLRVAREFERAHCALVHIAARASGRLSADLSAGSCVLIARMGDLAVEMWRVAADAWYRRDRLVARFYERLGDHAVNVAGRASYLAGSMSG